MVDENAANENQSTDEQLFNNISFEGLEDSLITVDVAEEELPAEVQEEINEGGVGDPPVDTKADPPDDEGKEKAKPVEKKEDDLIIVDKGKPAAGEEKKEDPPKGGEKPKEGTEAKTGEENLSPMYLHAAALHENGLLPDFDLESIKELKTEEQAVKINEHIQTNIDASIKEGVDAEVAKMGEAKQIYDDIKSGVDPQSLQENLSLEEIYGNIKVADLESSEENQEAIYSDFLSMKGLSDAKVKQLIQVAKDNESLLTEATDGLKEIQKEISNEREVMRKQAKENKEAHDKKNEATQEKIKTTVTATKEIIPGSELTKAEHDQLIKDMTVPVRYADNGRGGQTPVSRVMDLRSKDPIAFEMKLNYFISKGFFDKDAKFDNLTTKAETNASKKFIQKMNSDKSEATGEAAITKKKEKEETPFKFPFPTSQ